MYAGTADGLGGGSVSKHKNRALRSDFRRRAVQQQNKNTIRRQFNVLLLKELNTLDTKKNSAFFVAAVFYEGPTAAGCCTKCKNNGHIVYVVKKIRDIVHSTHFKSGDPYAI